MCPDGHSKVVAGRAVARKHPPNAAAGVGGRFLRVIKLVPWRAPVGSDCDPLDGLAVDAQQLGLERGRALQRERQRGSCVSLCDPVELSLSRLDRRPPLALGRTLEVKAAFSIGACRGDAGHIPELHLGVRNGPPRARHHAID